MNTLRRMLALISARNKEYFRDRAAMGWNFLFPFLVIVGFAFGSSGRQEDVFKWGVLGEPPAMSSLHELKAVTLVSLSEADSAIDKVRRHQLDLLLAPGPGGGTRYWVNAASNKSALSEQILRRSVDTPLLQESVQGAPIRYVDWLVPGIVCMNLMFNSLYGVGYVLVRYRKNGVLKRLNATPVRAFEFLAAQIASRIFLVIFSSAIFLGGARLLIGTVMHGSWWALLLVLTVGSACMISLSLVVAARVASEEVAEGLLNVLTWPMMFLSGAWFSLEGASAGVQAVSRYIPLTHLVEAARGIMIDGVAVSALLPALGLLGLMTLGFFIVGSVLFRWS